MCMRIVVRRAGDAAEGDVDDVVEDAFEVVEEDGVGGAFEDECELYIIRISMGALSFHFWRSGLI